MATRGSRRLIRSANCVLVSTQFDNVGDSVQFEMSSAGTLTPENFVRKSIMTRGSFVVEFNDGNDDLRTGDVWPTRNHVHAGKFSVKSIEPNSQYFCVIPTNDVELQNTVYQLDAGTTQELPLGTVNFVYGNNYSVNDKIYNSTEVIAVENSPAQLTAHETVRLVQCSSRPS